MKKADEKERERESEETVICRVIKEAAMTRAVNMTMDAGQLRLVSALS